MSQKNIYFVSDSHLGVPDAQHSMIREKKLVSWLDGIAPEASDIFLLGDIFDFWFEYSMVVPKGYVRLLGKLAEIVETGVRVHYFTGNHDMWQSDYFQSELGVKVYHCPAEFNLQGKHCYVGHGDGLGPGDTLYKLQKKLFASKMARKLFSFIHPGIGIRLALFLSWKSRKSNEKTDTRFLGADKESLVLYSKELLKRKQFDYFIFGHRHYPTNIEIAQGTRFINTGDWINHFSYAVMSEGEIELKEFSAGS